MGDDDPRTRFAEHPIARLATVTPDGAPHLVPVVFAFDAELIYTAVDAKPKTTRRLQRLVNIEHNPRVSVLVDHYDDDWTQLWWVRADGPATVHHHDATARLGYRLLRAKYPQYHAVGLDGPLIAVTVHRWVSWNARG